MRHRRRRSPLFTVLAAVGALAVAAALVALHAGLAAHTHLPIVMGDELGYVENGRYLALGGARPANTYFPGLSLLLVPVWWFTTNGHTVWRSAEVINIAAGLVTLVGAVVLGGICGLGRWARWLVALAASLYPPVLLYSDFSLSESLFQALFMWLVISLAGAVRRRTTGLWGVVGVLAGLATLVHPRGFAVIVAVVIVAALVWLRPPPAPSPTASPARRQGPGLVAAVTALVAGLVGTLALVRWATVATRAANLGGRYDYLPQSLVYRNENGQALSALFVSTVGRLLYQSVATAGIVPLVLVLGVIGLVALARRKGSPLDGVYAFTALSAAGVAAFTMLLGGTRPDQLIQGRYVDGVVAPILVAGLAAVFLERKWLLWLTAGALATAVSGGLFALTRHVVDGNQPINPANILGVEPIVRWAGTVATGPLVVAGVAAVLVLAVVSRFSPVAAVILIGAVFCAAAIDTQAQFIEPGSLAKSGQTVLVDTITAATAIGVPPQCVSYDNPEDFNFFSDRLLLGTQPLQLLVPGAAPCGPWVISGRPLFEAAFPGARLVAEENDVSEALFVLPGLAQDTLRARGWLLPDPTPGPLPLAHQSVSITVDGGGGAVTLLSGGTRTIRAIIGNTGTASPWPAAAALKQAAYAVRVAERWYPAGTDTSAGAPPAVAVHSVDLPRSLLPGQKVNLDVPLTAAKRGAPLAPGAYVVTLTVYQEGFRDLGQPATIAVQLT